MVIKKGHALKSYIASHRIASFITIAIVIIAIAGFGAYVVSEISRDNKAKQSSQAISCTEDRALIGKFTDSYRQNNTENLKSITEVVLEKENYDTDQNCLYILTASYLKVRDLNNAEAKFAEFSKIYQQSSAIQSSGEPDWQKESLETQIGLLRRMAQDRKENAKKLNHPNNRTQ
jgi:hypothetical protein